MFYNAYIVIPVVAWVVAQALKFMISAIRGRVDLKYLYASGGMPSGHAAVVCSLAAVAYLLDGPSSHLFGLTVILAVIVMYDSFGVRRSSGEQAQAINMLVASLSTDRIRLQNPELKLREVLGHKPGEVAAGAFLGILIAALFNLDRFSAQLNFLSSQPVRPEGIAYLVFFAVLLIGGIVTRVLARRRRSQAVRGFVKRLFWITEVMSWLGLIIVFGQYERLPYFSWRVWGMLLVVLSLSIGVWLFLRYRHVLPEALAAEQEADRKRKWFQSGKKSKRKKK